MPCSTMREALKRAESAGLFWPLPEGMNDEALEAALYANRRSSRAGAGACVTPLSHARQAYLGRIVRSTRSVAGRVSTGGVRWGRATRGSTGGRVTIDSRIEEQVDFDQIQLGRDDLNTENSEKR